MLWVLLAILFVVPLVLFYLLAIRSVDRFRAGAVVVVVSLLDVGLGGRRGAVGGCRYVQSGSLGLSV